MRLRHAGGRSVHLTYGTSVHPAQSLGDLIADLDRYAAVVRSRLETDVLGLSLWLPAPVAESLALDAGARQRLRSELDARGIEVVAFSAASLDQEAVGLGRYGPDWTTPERLDYTLNLARILVDLLPDDAVRGSVSTVPLGWRQSWGTTQERAAGRLLDRLSAGLTEIAWHTGRAVRVGFQPQPGCVIDSTEQAVTVLSSVDTDRLGVCLDLAALACAWEEPAEALARLAAGNIPIVRVRIGAAIEAPDPVAAAAVLRGYDEPRYPHQTTSPDGAYTDDLGEALRTMPPGPWRVRYELPLHAVPPAPLTATTSVWRSAVDELMAGAAPGCDHFDVATETWNVLPPVHRPAAPEALADGIAAELACARDALAGIGLAPAVCVR